MSRKTHDDLMNSIDEKANEIIKDMPVFAEKYFNNMDDRNLSKRTKLQYAYDMKQFFDFFSERYPKIKTMSAAELLEDISLEDLQEYTQSLKYHYSKDGKKQLNSNGYKARRIASLHSFYAYYHKIGLIDKPTALLIDNPKINSHEIKLLDNMQVDRLLEAIKMPSGERKNDIEMHNMIEKRDFAIMMLFLGTGIRVSELVGIDMQDIDFVNGSVLVHRKGGDTTLAYFGLEVEEALIDYRDNCRDALNTNNEDAFFISLHHKRLSVRSVETMIKTYKEKAGINTKATPHTLRRVFGTAVYNETGDIYLTAAALNQKSVETTRKYYAKMSEEKRRSVVNASKTIFKKD